MSFSLTEQLADWMVAHRAHGFDAEAIAIARDYVTDWLGSALAGHTTEPGKMLLDYAAAQPVGACHVIGRELCVSAETAALVNGGLSHIVEMDDLDRASVTHPGCVVIPAALAVAEQIGASGYDLLSAVIVGYELVCRIGAAVGSRHYYYFHNTATCGVFGAAAAAGWLLGLSAEQLVWALGNAGTMAAGLWQFNADGAMSKHLHAGRAAANGVLAATLAATGFTGAREILEGKRGFFAATAPDADPDVVCAGLGSDELRIANVSIKPHASCRHTHPAIDAALAMRGSIDVASVAAIHIETYQAALDLCDNPDPCTAYAAKFSLHYCVAAALVRGAVGLAAFSAETLFDPTIRALLPRITLVLDTALDAAYPQQWSSRIRVVTNNGVEFEQTVHFPLGDPDNRLNSAELHAKFRQLATYGGSDSVLWLQWLDSLPTSPSVAGTIGR